MAASRAYLRTYFIFTKCLTAFLRGVPWLMGKDNAAENDSSRPNISNAKFNAKLKGHVQIDRHTRLCEGDGTGLLGIVCGDTRHQALQDASRLARESRIEKMMKVTWSIY